jgi:ribose transport system permease protein
VLNILLQASNIGIVAAGLTVVVIIAEIDLSVGSLEALVRAIAAVAIISHDVPVAIGIPLALAVGIVAGGISGLLTARLKVVSFVSTLAMLGIAQGTALLRPTASRCSDSRPPTARSARRRWPGSRRRRSSRSSSSCSCT